MLIGSIIGQPWMRAWSILIGVVAMGRYIAGAMTQAAEEVMDHTRRWAHRPFENGYRSGFETGRESGVSEGFTLATGQPDPDRRRT